MAFYDYIRIPTVIDLASDDKPQALKELCAALCKAVRLRRKKAVVEEMERREDSASTFVGQGVALPQTRGSIDDEFAIAVGRSVSGVKYDAARGALAHIIVLTIAKEDTDQTKVIQILSDVAQFFKSDNIREQILSGREKFDLRSLFPGTPRQAREEKNTRLMRRNVNPVVSAALDVAKDVKAKAILVFTDAVRDNDFLDFIKPKGLPVFIVTSNRSRFEPGEDREQAVIFAPPFPGSRTGQLKVSILLALSRNLIAKDDKVVCLSGNSRTGMFDTVVVIDIAVEYEFFLATGMQSFVPPDVRPEVLERVLVLASEIAIEGREGKPRGTIFVIGDTNSVVAHVRQLIINPFRGYSETERNILDPGLDETIKEFAGIDGAFIITGDGVVLSAGSYLRPPLEEQETLPSGFGVRHAASAAITACTNALAITVSQSTGMVTLFKNGAVMLTLSRPAPSDKNVIQKVL